MTDYLLKVLPSFQEELDKTGRSDWRVGSGMAGYKGAEGVPVIISETPGAIGYLSSMSTLFEREQNSRSPVRYGRVRNSEGEWIAASKESLTAASAAEVPFISPNDFRFSITNPPGKMSYPIASFIWLLAYDSSEDEQRHGAVVDFLTWVLTHGPRTSDQTRLSFSS